MEAIAGLISLIALFILIIIILIGLHNVFFELPSNVKRIANALEKIAENTKKKDLPPKIVEVPKTSDSDDEEKGFLI